MTNRGWQYSMRPIDGADILIGMARCGYGGCQRISGLVIAQARDLRIVMSGVFNNFAAQIERHGWPYDEHELALVAKRFTMMLQEGETEDFIDSAGLLLDIQVGCPYTLPDVVGDSAHSWGEVMGNFLDTWHKTRKLDHD